MPLQSGIAGYTASTGAVINLSDAYADSRFDAQLKVLQAWQCERLLRTHADLANDARYGPGVRFFVEDLYAPKDFTARDTDIERALPAMVRLLPNRVLDTAADAAGLYVLNNYEADPAAAGRPVLRLPKQQ